ncbi:transposase [Streptomyces sp. MS2.AVA.5]|uniref:Transposase n=1 Tax=Streptomyces achmelvichensis TaxID=3134111 RepID=A0ACC6PM56_9ACTN
MSMPHDFDLMDHQKISARQPPLASTNATSDRNPDDKTAGLASTLNRPATLLLNSLRGWGRVRHDRFWGRFSVVRPWRRWGVSMRPVGLLEIPERTVVVARAAFPKGSLAIRVRDRLAEVFVDEPFVAAFGVCGAPGLSPGVLSLVTVLQFAEDLTDRQAAAMAVRAIDWKYATGVELTDTGFDFSVLSRFRARLADNGMERVVFDRLLEHCGDAGLVAAGGKQRTDATHVISAVRDLNRLELAGESLRAALEALCTVAPLWLAGQIDVTEFAERYGPRIDGWKMPSSRTKRDRLAQVFGQDALALCRAAWAGGAPGFIREIEAVDLLRQVLVQTYTIRGDSRGRQVIKKRDADDGVPPGQLRLASPYDRPRCPSIPHATCTPHSHPVPARADTDAPPAQGFGVVA